MSTVRDMTTGQAKELAIILAQAGLTDLTYEQAERLLGNKGELNANVRALQARLAGVDNDEDKLESKPNHSEIRIKRTIGGEEIVFVGFIFATDEDGLVNGDTMMRRVRKAGFEPIQDSKLLHRNRKDWADDSELSPYYVVTGERHPNSPRRVRFFHRDGRERSWNDLGFRFYRGTLVACRVRKFQK